jgi:hypothetical protein
MVYLVFWLYCILKKIKNFEINGFVLSIYKRVIVRVRKPIKLL